MLRDANGEATTSPIVDDADEVIRWALGFGDEACLGAPPTAVAHARETVDRNKRRYASPRGVPLPHISWTPTAHPRMLVARFSPGVRPRQRQP
jgi:hypothetical protein